MKQKINNLLGNCNNFCFYTFRLSFLRHKAWPEGRLIGDGGTDSYDSPNDEFSRRKPFRQPLLHNGFTLSHSNCASLFLSFFFFSFFFSEVISHCTENTLVCISSARRAFSVSLQRRFLAFSPIDEFVPHRKQWGFLCLRNDVSWGLPLPMFEFRFSDTNFRNQ
jgi:hypothetical protein